MENYEKKTAALLEDLKKKASRLMERRHYESALCCIRAFAELAYQYNQFYTDEEMENLILVYERSLPHARLTADRCKRNRVLFYDGFGLDTRGLVLIYLNALVKLGYEVIYITIDTARNRQTEVPKILSKGKSRYYSLKTGKPAVSRTNQIIKVFEKEMPTYAFFYTTPNDVEGEIAFSHFSGVVKRFQINLTDHAFWMGKHAFDYCIEFRCYGASITRRFRGVSKEQIRMLPYYPWIDESLPFEGFPFEDFSFEGFPSGNFSSAGVSSESISSFANREEMDTDARKAGCRWKIIFSGGALYKTIDKGRTYYHMVDRILKRNTDVLFVYAGSGEGSAMEWLSGRHPGRVYLMAERKDLYQVMKHVDIYLSTFPMTGGLMAQYAAAAGKPPLTLIAKGAEDAKGFLIDDDKLGIYFDNSDKLIKELERLFLDPSYYAEKCRMVSNSVIKEEDFMDAFSELLSGGGVTTYAVNDKEIDTREFLNTYLDRLSGNSIRNAVATKRTKGIFWLYPRYFIRKGLDRAKGSVKRYCKKGGYW